MRLGFLAVESVRRVVEGAVQLAEAEEHGGGERDAFVGWAEEEVELGGGGRGEGGGDGVRVGGGEGAEERGGVEEACVEEVWRCAAGFEGEGAEGEDLVLEAQGEEVFFVLWDRHCGGAWGWW